MCTASAVKEIKNRVRTWCENHAVHLCVLFGSQASGKAHAQSDVDLAIWPSEEMPPLTRLRWLRELETSLDRNVSLVIVSPATDPLLGFEIVRHGVVVYEAEPESWVEERLRLWHRYNDSLPFRRAERQKMHEFAEEVRRGT
jgi:uncharacterized protein